VATKRLRYPVVWNGSSTTLTFDSRGLTTDIGSMCILPININTLTSSTVANSAAVDSIVVSSARINLGWRKVGECKSDNIDQK